jgi:hypothetical protein
LIAEFDEVRPSGGQLQIIQGAVGSGKSLFTRRYREVMQSQDLSDRTRWAFVDFNYSPADISQAEGWLCKEFAESFQRENPTIDMSSGEVLRGVFSRNIQKRKAIYDELSRTSASEAAVARARDLAAWQDSPEETARGIADYVLGSRHDVLIAVMDNVDRLDLHGQLDAFQLALWFMQLTRCFVILQMRDETYERYKDKPPLDTFRTGVTFHISPPRLTDVVRRRLELSYEYLAAHAEKKQSYAVETGARVSYPGSELESFLRGLYSELFDRRRNITRVLEATAGWDVRRALEMFVSIITSGHLSTAAITSTVLGGRGVPITEQSILRILMRTEYRFFSDSSGFLSNIFTFDPEWQKPDNFLLVEILYFLARNRKARGQIGLEGYFTCRYVADELQRLGYVAEDVLAAINMLLNRRLVAADHMNFSSVSLDDSVHILASGFMHVRLIAARMEYIYGVIPATPMFDRPVADRLSEFIKNESLRGRIASHQKVEAVEIFYRYLLGQRATHRTPFSLSDDTGAAYVLRQMAGAIEHAKNVAAGTPSEPDPLDF